MSGNRTIRQLTTGMHEWKIEKDYAGPWLDGNPPVFYVGVNYDPEKRNIDDPIVEPA